MLESFLPIFDPNEEIYRFMKTTILLLLSLFVYISSYGQNAMLTAAINMGIAAENANSFNRDKSIAGSPYAEEEMVEGVFFLKNSTAVESKTRLNYYRSSFEFVVDENTYLIDPATIDSIVVNKKTYLFKVMEYNGKKLPRVLQIIKKSDKTSLYQFTGVELKPAVKASGYVDPKPACYQWDQPVYVMEIKGLLIELSNFKQLLKQFPENETAIKSFIKEKKINKNNPEKLIQLMQYIDSLI
jgi:hypothetical protein